MNLQPLELLAFDFYAHDIIHLFRVKFPTSKISRSEVVTWPTNTNTMSLKPVRSGASVPTPLDPTS